MKYNFELETKDITLLISALNSLEDREGTSKQIMDLRSNLATLIEDYNFVFNLLQD